MTINTLQDILPLVEQPSRYLGTEINAVRKDHNTVALRVALAFPDLYEIGMSHFGLQILYSILNRDPEIAAERVFTPGVDMEAHLRAADIPLMSLETHTPLKRFDIIGVSLLYELNFTNILTILDLAQIPFYSKQRNASHPVIIAGGPCACNPEPLADMFDAMVIGDGEEVVCKMTETWIHWKREGDEKRKTLLQLWSKIEGVYIPAFFKPKYNKSGFQILSPVDPDHRSAARAVISSLDEAFFPEAPIVPFGRPVHDRLRLEVARGCTRGCRFCQAGMIYRPVRERAPETLLEQSRTALGNTGYGNLSLLSLSTGDYGAIIPLMELLMDYCDARRTAISLPSIRAGTLTPKLMSLIKRVRKTGFTIAPEAGSQRLRDAINKNITEEDIHQTVENAFRLGWQVIKLYFMIGLPTETEEDLDALVRLVKSLHNIKTPKGRNGKLNVSIASFIPKPHTPFQWLSQLPLFESKEKIKWIQSSLRMPGVQLKWQNPEMSILEGLWARGDRRLSRLLVSAFEKGCRFDGWGDQFRFETWQQALSDTGIDMDFYTTRTRDLNEPLPWDHIDMKLSRGFLSDEWEKSLKGEKTEDCRAGDCHMCGVCDFSDLKPVVFDGSEGKPGEAETSNGKEPAYVRMKASYEKMKQAKYFGHLELRNILLRAIRRAGIPVKYSQGFHPMPKVSFDDPLPVGTESRQEFFYITLEDTMKPRDVMKRLNDNLPEGLSILNCQLWTRKSAKDLNGSRTYEIMLPHDSFDKTRLDDFIQQKAWLLQRVNRKGRTAEIDLKQIVTDIDLHSSNGLKMVMKTVPGKTPRPIEVLASVFNLPEESAKQARIIKLP
ncbi:MAG TPA: TIGR03960 family B12-binding radical SAM protein [Deltaproteobacteria bacterium]|nr:TIGR03960 family B12-binding radical SAM protein [Deltaproteobacteria bacterium]